MTVCCNLLSDKGFVNHARQRIDHCCYVCLHVCVHWHRLITGWRDICIIYRNIVRVRALAGISAIKMFKVTPEFKTTPMFKLTLVTMQKFLKYLVERQYLMGPSLSANRASSKEQRLDISGSFMFYFLHNHNIHVLFVLHVFHKKWKEQPWIHVSQQ